LIFHRSCIIQSLSIVLRVGCVLGKREEIHTCLHVNCPFHLSGLNQIWSIFTSLREIFHVYFHKNPFRISVVIINIPTERRTGLPDANVNERGVVKTWLLQFLCFFHNNVLFN